jgi:aspartokinase
VNVVYKFGGSSVRDAERMREVADIICSFPEHLPVVVLSAMGKVRHQYQQAAHLHMTHNTCLLVRMSAQTFLISLISSEQPNPALNPTMHPVS